MQSLRWSIISFTEKGAELAEKIKRLSKEQQLPCEIHTYHGRKQVENLNAWTKEQFSLRNVILFIGACGIAVRTIAPFLKDKLTDSPVLVLDEAGNYVIPLLSGHVGGANEIALLLAELLGAVPVITTATDINNTFAIDVFAKKHDLSIDKKEGIKKVSAKVLEKKKLSMAIYLSTGMLEKLSERLIKGGYSKDTTAALAYKVSWPEEEIYICTVETLAQTAAEHGITKTALVLVGDVINKSGYSKSRLYAEDFSTEFRAAKKS